MEEAAEEVACSTNDSALLFGVQQHTGCSEFAAAAGKLAAYRQAHYIIGKPGAESRRSTAPNVGTSYLHL